MTVTHHPNLTTLIAFSAGTLDEPYAAVIATHLAMSEAGRKTVRQINTIGGALLSAEPDAAMADGALDRLLDAAGDEPLQTPPAPDHALPAPLASYLPGGLESVRWKWTGPGVAVADLPVQRRSPSRLMLLRVGAGRRVPEHSHGGHELTLIIKGAYKDRFGVFAAGDIADHDEDVEHQPIAEDGEDCICMVAVDAPLNFRSRLIRTLQPLFGM
ncbi:ChrR family anti-sigma-E factor [Devosia sp.]|uniref:ChrR family anti-sigma-E factor n=1 Tax=Devosia sp. TaxID=1871048 RepID=UPI003267355F